MVFRHKPTFYTLYTRGDGQEQELVAVRGSFSWLAFLFGMFWAAFNRLWLMAMVGFVTILALIILQVAGIGSDMITNIGNVLVNIWFGCEAVRFKERKLLRDGYTLETVIYAPDAISAKITAYERQTA